MTKIILAFPCMGKTYYAQNHPDKAIDLESSDYFFDRTGYEHLSSEEFKGIENRKPNPNGLKDYLSAIKKNVESRKYKYIFTSQQPDVVKGIMDMGYNVHYVKPHPTNGSEEEFIKRAKLRGNNESWINGTSRFLKPHPYDFIDPKYHKQVYVHLVPSHSYVADVIEKDII